MLCYVGGMLADVGLGSWGGFCVGGREDVSEVLAGEHFGRMFAKLVLERLLGGSLIPVHADGSAC
jgi:hypothetical protein